MKWFAPLFLAAALPTAPALKGDVQKKADWPAIDRVEAQPLISQARRVRQALEQLGGPLPKATADLLTPLKADDAEKTVAAAVQKALDPHCVAAVEIAKDGKVTVTPAAGRVPLLEQGWRAHLVKVINRAGSTGVLRVDSPNARPVANAPAAEVKTRWLGLATYTGQPLLPNLSGLGLEYRVVQLFARDSGDHSAALAFRVEGGKTDRLVLADWRFDKGAGGWKAASDCSLEVAGGKLKVISTGTDPYLVAPATGPKGEMVLRFWAKFDQAGFGQVFWNVKDRPRFDGRHFANFRFEGGKGREYEVRFRCDGELKEIRIDPGFAKGVTVFDWITLARVGGASDWQRATVRFDVKPSVPVTFRVLDESGKPTMAEFLIRDAAGHVYPAQSKRLAPDLFFHPQIYRETGEQVRLPPGKYTVRCRRGPESIPEVKTLTVGTKPVTLLYEVKRWIDPAKRGWYSGDHHIHAAGCQHYDRPTEGVRPEDMMRHVLGEDLKIGCCLTWGPCFDYQKRFFTGKPDKVSKPPYLLRYDIEVSGFGSHNSGHLCLLGLTEQIPPGGRSKDHWPTLGLNTLKWAKKQGAVCGPAHSASGLTRIVGKVEGKEGPGRLPNFGIPAYDGIGANEFIVDVTHEVPGPDGKPVPAIDFISTMNTDRTAEWNMWYHVLNCGMRVRASGETDFPCITGERVGMWRVYVKVDGKLDFDRWVKGVADGRSYVTDGTTHLMGVTAAAGKQKAEMGVAGSEMKLDGPAKVEFTVQAAARLAGAPEVPVELVVNGYPVQSKKLKADGAVRELTFEAAIERSSWAAIRVRPRAHANPIFILVDGKPIRASSASAEWCLKGVDQCWKQKKKTYAANEQKDAEAAYEHARRTYRRILQEAKAAEAAGKGKTGRLELRIEDEGGRLMPARVHLAGEDGKPIRPEGLPFWRDHFVCDGKVSLDLPCGEVRYAIERGPEHQKVSWSLDLTEAGAQRTVRLKRLIDLPALGWHPGDLHVHRPVSDVPLLMRAEDLSVAGVITWWNAQNAWKGGGVPKETVRSLDGGRRLYDLMGGEDERGGGALLYFNRSAPLDITRATREHPSSLAFLAAARKDKQTFVDVEKPFWWDVPAWLATGQVDSVGIAHNHMHRAGVLDNEAWGRPRDRKKHPGPAGNGWWTQEIYYHLLNAGLRVPPSAGSASGVLPNPVGHNRVYVGLGGEKLSYPAWLEGLRQGRCFVTNGPLLLARADAKWPGHTFQSNGALSVTVEVEVTGNEPVQAVELIKDGVVVKRVALGRAAWRGKIGPVAFRESGWLLVRALGDMSRTFRFASTAPWYVEVGKDAPRPISKRSASFFLAWARERRQDLSARVKGAAERAAVLADHDRAVAYWEARQKSANRP